MNRPPSQRDKVLAAVRKLRQPTDVSSVEIRHRILRILGEAVDAQLVVTCRFVEHDGVVRFHSFQSHGPESATQRFAQLNDTPVPEFVDTNLRRPKPRERNRFMHVGPHRKTWERIVGDPNFQATYGQWGVSDILQINVFDDRHCLAWISVCRTGDRPGYSNRITQVLTPLIEPIRGALRRAATLEREAGCLHDGYVVAGSDGDGLIGCDRARLWLAECSDRAGRLRSALDAHGDGDGFVLGGTFVRVRPLSGDGMAVLGHLSPLQPPEWSPEADLSPRQRDAALKAARGESVKEIAAAMMVSPDTVRGYLQEAYRRLGVSNRAELARALSEPAPR